jgi:hypothetical protein
LQLFPAATNCQEQLNPDNSVYYREIAAKTIERIWSIDYEMFSFYRGFADMQTKRKSLNVHSENCLFACNLEK